MRKNEMGLQVFLMQYGNYFSKNEVKYLPVFWISSPPFYSFTEEEKIHKNNSSLLDLTEWDLEPHPLSPGQGRKLNKYDINTKRQVLT